MRAHASGMSIIQSSCACLLQLARLIATLRVELGAPHLVNALVLGAAEVYQRAKPEIEMSQARQPLDETLGVVHRSGSLEAFDHDIGSDVALERYVVGRLAGKVVRVGGLVFQHDV